MSAARTSATSPSTGYTSGQGATKPPEMPSQKAKHEEMWVYIKHAIDLIMDNGALDNAHYIGLYSTVMNYCSSSRMVKVPQPGTDVPALVSPEQDLYNKLSRYLSTYFQISDMVQRSENLSAIDLLRYYTTEWAMFTAKASFLDRVFAYMNRHYFRRELKEMNKVAKPKRKFTVFPVYKLCLSKWKDHFLLSLQNDGHRLSCALLDLISQERHGVIIDQEAMKTALQSFVEVGLDITDPTGESLDFYKAHFETAFIQESEAYYKEHSEKMLVSHSTSDYPKRIEAYLQEESERADRYMHPTTREALIKKCENALLQKDMEAFPGGSSGIVGLEQE